MTDEHPQRQLGCKKKTHFHPSEGPHIEKHHRPWCSTATVAVMLHAAFSCTVLSLSVVSVWVDCADFCLYTWVCSDQVWLSSGPVLTIIFNTIFYLFLFIHFASPNYSKCQSLWWGPDLNYVQVLRFGFTKYINTFFSLLLFIFNWFW